jgi:hypothetical protein
MDYKFKKVSEIKHKAYKRAFTHFDQSNSKKIVKQIVGINPLNKEWVDAIHKNFSLATKSTGIAKVNALVSVLDMLYFCEWILSQSQSTDPDIARLLPQSETGYLNSCLNYIEKNIHSSNLILQSFNTLISAVDVLSEGNPQMAQKYKQMLSRYQSVHSSYMKIKEICDVQNKRFDNKQASQIASLISHHESALKLYPSIKENIAEIVHAKLDETLMNTTIKTEKILSDPAPSIKSLCSVLSSFVDIYKPLSPLFSKKRYDDIESKMAHFQKVNNVILSEYPEWQKTYQYYTLPRNQIDESKILQVIKSINNYQGILTANFSEIKGLTPSPATILQHLSNMLDQQGKDTIIYYLRKENELLNATDSDERSREIVRFLLHINEKIVDVTSPTQLVIELKRIKVDFLEILDRSAESQIKFFLASPHTHSSIKVFFDKILSHFFQLNDLEKIAHWQHITKMLTRAIVEMPDMIKNIQHDSEYYHSLPHSPVSETLKEKLSDALVKINEVLPLMALYKMSDVHRYMSVVEEIKISICLPENVVGECGDKLIIIDKFSNKNILIFKNETLSFGREMDENDIVLKSDWVSAVHCQIDFKNEFLIDCDSTNGTFINAEQIQIVKHALSEVKSFCIAEAFDFLIEKCDGFFLISLGKVLDTELINRDKVFVSSLYNTCFVWLKKYASVSIDSFTSKVVKTDKDNPNELVITLGDHFTIIDKEKNKTIVHKRKYEEVYTDRYNITLS